MPESDVDAAASGETSDLSAGAGRAARIGLVAGPVLALLSFLIPAGPDLAMEARWVLALLILMATWWITEAMPLAATSLIPIIALPLIGIEVSVNARGALACATQGLCLGDGPVPASTRLLTLGDLGAYYANPVVLLYIGGFLLGIAIERWGLSTRIAYAAVARGGANPKLMLAGFIVAAGFISMWISNTSTSLILTPLALSVAAGAALGGEENPRFAASLVLSIAYAATIGGLATPIGTPPNGIALTQLRAQGIDVSFGQWMSVGLPVVLVLLPIAWLILSRGLRIDAAAAAGAQSRVREELARLGHITAPELRVALVFLVIAGLWTFSTPLADFLGARILKGRIDSGNVDTMTATLGALLLFLTPAGGGRNRAILTWEDAGGIPWGILLLFGGGLALAAGADLSGLSRWLAQGLSGLADLPPVIVILGIGALVIVITEFASNIATISLMGPVLLSLSNASDKLTPAAFIVPAAMAASMGFAMPVGSASNAIAYGTGKVRQADMIRRGLMMNLAALAALTLAGLYLAPLVLR